MNNLLALVLFSLFVLTALTLDLGLFQRSDHTPALARMAWYAAWLLLAVLFNLGVWAWQGPESALEFLAGYTLELSLSADNVLVFAVIFATTAVPVRYQHRVLFWGIVGALVMRVMFIFVGVELVSRFHGILYVFGGFLVVTGARVFWQRESQLRLERYRVLRLVRRVIPLAQNLEGAAFFVRGAGRVMATPLFLALVMIEATDVLFAVDSIPAVFAVTQNPFIIHFQHICHPGVAGALFPARRGDYPLPLFARPSCARADVRGRQNASRAHFQFPSFPSTGGRDRGSLRAEKKSS